MKEYYQKPEVKQNRKEYYQKPEVKQKMKEYMKEYMKKYYFAIKNNWECLSDEEQLRLMNEKAKEILSNQSPTSQTSPNGDFSNEKEHNISLKESSEEDSQISSNDETSLNNNIKLNSGCCLAGR
jgi:hypothetical protein